MEAQINISVGGVGPGGSLLGHPGSFQPLAPSSRPLIALPQSLLSFNQRLLQPSALFLLGLFDTLSPPQADAVT